MRLGFSAATSSMSMPPSVENRISGLARGGVVQHGGIEFAHDLGLLLDQQALDGVVADRHAEDLGGHPLGFLRRAGELDAAGLAALCRSAPAP